MFVNLYPGQMMYLQGSIMLPLPDKITFQQSIYEIILANIPAVTLNQREFVFVLMFHYNEECTMIDIRNITVLSHGDTLL